jgi:hypothetical protein
MRDKDVLFAANAATVDTAKFLQFLHVILPTARSPVFQLFRLVVLVRKAASAEIRPPHNAVCDAIQLKRVIRIYQ